MTDNQYLTVTALTKYLKRKFDADPYLKRVYLTGEISNFRLRPRHQYFSLKDEHAKISAIMFQSAFAKIKFQPEEGMKVLVSGYVSLYEASGQYQIYVDRMEPDGIGALYKAYEQLKAKLRQEGAFDVPKKPIPKFPRRIAVITSPSGAVIRDIITTVQRRFPIVQLVLFPALVQGQEAADSLVNCLNQVGEISNFDTVIIGRGGGSIEDLWPFNEEKVARAILKLQIPVISSVGHETDTTIADLVADLRAPTPTAAAELATPVLQEVILQIQQQRTLIFQALRSILIKKRQLLNVYQENYLFKNPQNLYRDYSQQVDQLTNALQDAIKHQLEANKQKLRLLQQSLKFQQPQLQNYSQQVQLLEKNLSQNYGNYLKERQHQLAQQVTNLDSLSPLKTLQRGYAVVSAQQQVITQTRLLSPHQQIQIRLADGKFTAQVLKIEAENNDK
ncbi:exodeoxyribonuclease VII large subunit [Bombilactobacillus bombi]|uniref:exodeoxyribonuclease VII large subunit n=1 Tax=Bombilactobacillus bombi TaxID=1303590 RepID=UPI0015E5EF3B|nr:exodeoxyribonuclease VII large subunit [Bombilactobacillus bombi]MBA1435139.1 exodeoxyribonuclease VII large subunit [Bombilactobacillus bombi]